MPYIIYYVYEDGYDKLFLESHELNKIIIYRIQYMSYKLLHGSCVYSIRIIRSLSLPHMKDIG